MSCKRHKYTLTYMLRVASSAERMGKLKVSWNLSSVTWCLTRAGTSEPLAGKSGHKDSSDGQGLSLSHRRTASFQVLLRDWAHRRQDSLSGFGGSDAHPDGLLAHCFHRRPCFINRLQREVASVNVWKGMLAWVFPLLVSAGTKSPEVKGEGVLFSLFSTCLTSLSSFFYCNSQI